MPDLLVESQPVGLRISFELDEDDLKHFRLIMREARKSAARLAPEDIVAGAEALLGQVRDVRVPQFINERLERLNIMIRMLKDHEWRLPGAESTRVLNALAYFTEPEDLIPDHIPGVGFLDDAIMVELVVRELKHEIEAYRDFCDYRTRHQPRPGIKRKTSDVTRDQWLEKRREELQSRMRRRRKRRDDGEGGRRPLGLL
jgi:uncharacterized membrane protein YkvA (DUF1232 family)